MTQSQPSIRQRYGEPASHVHAKVLGQLDTHSQRFIEASPFLVLATHDSEGHMDASPRGGAPGFVEIIDEKTLHIPDRPGNARLDSLQNLSTQREVGLLFFLPGVNETLRVNGCADILFDDELLSRYSIADNTALAVIELTISEVFFHGGKALIRSRLWDSDLHADQHSFPTLGEIIVDQVDGLGDEETEELLKFSNYQGLY